MEVFSKFRTVKRILKTVVFGLVLANAQQAFTQTAYRWCGGGDNTNWTNSANWEKYTGTISFTNNVLDNAESIGRSEDSAWEPASDFEYPKNDFDVAFFTGEAISNVTLSQSILINSIFFNTKDSNKITVNLNSYNNISGFHHLYTV